MSRVRDDLNALFARTRVRVTEGIGRNLKGGMTWARAHARTLAYAQQAEPVDLAVFTARKYSVHDTFGAYLWWLRREHPQLRVAVYLCCETDQAFLRDRFYAEFLAGIGVEVQPLGQQGVSSKQVARLLLAAVRPRAIVLDDRLLWGGEGRDQPVARAVIEYLRARNLPLFVRHHGVLQWPILCGEDVPDPPEIRTEHWLSQTEELLPLRGGLEPLPSACVGTPGFDQDWIDHCAGPRDRRRERPVCLYSPRTFQPPGQPHRFGDMTVEEWRAVARGLFVDTGLRERFEIVIKPYPTVPEAEVRAALDPVLSDYRLEWGSMFGLLPEIDLLVTDASSIFWMPYLARIPSIVFGFGMLEEARRGVQSPHDPEYVERLWPAYYSVLERPEDLGREVERLLDADGRWRPEAAAEVEVAIAHFRRFFPDGACERTFARMQALLPDWP